jgi:hypothetical protein
MGTITLQNGTISQAMCSLCGQTYRGENYDWKTVEDIVIQHVDATDKLVYKCKNCEAGVCVECSKRELKISFWKPLATITCPRCGQTYGPGRILLRLGTLEPGNLPPGTCWYCRTLPAKDDTVAKLKMSSRKTEETGKYIKTTTRETTVEIPRCSECKSKHNKARTIERLAYIGGTLATFGSCGGISVGGTYLFPATPGAPWWLLIAVGVVVVLGSVIAGQIMSGRALEGTRPFLAETHPAVRMLETEGLMGEDLL